MRGSVKSFGDPLLAFLMFLAARFGSGTYSSKFAAVFQTHRSSTPNASQFFSKLFSHINAS